MDYKKLAEFFNTHDIFAHQTGAHVLEVREGYAKSEIELSEANSNSLGMLHGGAIYTIADITASIAALSHGFCCTTLNANINYLRAVKAGKVFAEATEIHNGRTTKIYEVLIKSEEGKNISLATVTMFCSTEPYKF